MLFGTVNEADVVWPTIPSTHSPDRQPMPHRADDQRGGAAVVISGSGALYSDAAAALADWIEHTGMPFCTTPQGRGVVPEDHRFFYANARSKTLREADVVLVVGT